MRLPTLLLVLGLLGASPTLAQEQIAASPSGAVPLAEVVIHSVDGIAQGHAEPMQPTALVAARLSETLDWAHHAEVALPASDVAGRSEAGGEVLRLHAPLIDAPYNVAHGLRGPSMAQSLAVTEAFYELSHLGIERLLGRGRFLTGVAVTLFDVFTIGVPGADAWLHEEFHRAVMGNRGIDSYNDVYKLDWEAEVIAVSQVRDEDLVRLKAEHPAEQVRLGVAGSEGEYLLAQRLERNRFFGQYQAKHGPLLWLIKLSSLDYIWSGHTLEADTLTDEMNASDGADVRVRDFTGHDFTAWAYDLHRPNEPYTSRGVHPSGVGIDRYIRMSDLTEEERSYLERQGKLQWLNFLDPNLLGRAAFTVTSPLNGEPLRFNLSAGHVLTSFGHTVDLNFFLQQRGWNLFVVLHRYENGARTFPGVDAEIVGLPVRVKGENLLLSPRVALWLQPEQQSFRTSNATPGGLLALRALRPASSRWSTFVDVEAKTSGWVPGNVHLDPNLGVRLGASMRIR